jgi:hypothetical protein
MKSYWIVLAFAFVCGNTAAFAPQRPSFSSSTELYSAFRPTQNKGESDVDFIKRITSPEGFTTAQKMASGETPENKNSTEETSPKKVGKYRSIEEWDSERNSKGEMTWEERAQFDGQRFGDQVRQDSILRRQLNSPF